MTDRDYFALADYHEGESKKAPAPDLAALEKRVATLERLVRSLVDCPRCSGLGHVTKSDGPDECPECQGSGRRES